MVIEIIRDDQARKPLAEARDGIDRARRQLAQHCQPFRQLRELLEMLIDGALHSRFAQMVIAQGQQLAQRIVTFSAYRKIGNFEQTVRGFPHGGNHNHRLSVEAGFDDAGYSFERRRGFDGRAAEFHDDHQSSNPSEYINSAFRTAAPAAPRTVLWPSAMNL